MLAVQGVSEMKSSFRKIGLILLLVAVTVSVSGCPNTDTLFTGYSSLSLTIGVTDNSQIECAFPNSGFPGFSFDLSGFALFPTDPDVVDLLDPDLEILTISELLKVDLAVFEPQVLDVQASTGNYTIKSLQFANMFMIPGANSQNVCEGTEIACDPNTNPCVDRGNGGSLACVRRCGGGPPLPCADLPFAAPVPIEFLNLGDFEVSGDNTVLSFSIDAEAMTSAVYESHWAGGPSCAVFDVDTFLNLAPTFLIIN
jgi:hypothetical protein